jgi:N-acetylornithine carbamoyltransferase
MDRSHKVGGSAARGPAHVVSLEDLSDERLAALLERARGLDGAPRTNDLASATIGLLFFKGSLRTRSSLEAAIAQLGGHSINLTAHTDFWELEYRDGRAMDGRAPEHVRDAAAVLSSYVDLLAVRPPTEGASWAVDRTDHQIRAWARHARVPVLNMESSLWHPLQALADLYTLAKSFKTPARRTLCLAWTHSPSPAPVSVAHSILVAAARSGWDVRIAHPPGYDLDAEVVRRAEEHATARGTTIEHVTDLASGVEGADVVYARSWQCLDTYGDPTVSATRAARFADRRIDESLMRLGRDAKLMHALPVRRNVECTDEVLDGPRSLILEQAAARLPCQKALLLDLLGR